MSFDLNNAKIVPFNVTEDDLRKVLQRCTKGT